MKLSLISSQEVHHLKGFYFWFCLSNSMVRAFEKVDQLLVLRGLVVTLSCEIFQAYVGWRNISKFNLYGWRTSASFSLLYRRECCVDVWKDRFIVSKDDGNLLWRVNSCFSGIRKILTSFWNAVKNVSVSLSLSWSLCSSFPGKWLSSSFEIIFLALPSTWEVVLAPKLFEPVADLLSRANRSSSSSFTASLNRAD